MAMNVRCANPFTLRSSASALGRRARWVGRGVVEGTAGRKLIMKLMISLALSCQSTITTN
jgi:hypothetical protein